MEAKNVFKSKHGKDSVVGNAHIQGYKNKKTPNMNKLHRKDVTGMYILGTVWAF